MDQVFAAFQKNQALVQALGQCITTCEMCAAACLQEDDVKMMVPCIQLDRDCAAICGLTLAYVARNSPHAPHVMRECIEICQKCADECGKHEHDHCQYCAEACRQCVEACKSYAA